MWSLGASFSGGWCTSRDGQAAMEAHTSSTGTPTRAKPRPALIAAIYVAAVLALMTIAVSGLAGELSETAFLAFNVALSFAAGLALRKAWALWLPIGPAAVYVIVSFAVIESGSSSEWDSLSRILVAAFFLLLVFVSEAGMIAGMGAGWAIEQLRGRREARA